VEKFKEYLIRHGEKIAVAVICLLLVVLFFARLVPLGEIPNLAEMASKNEERIRAADDDPPDRRAIAEAMELANKDWLGLVKNKTKNPVDDIPAPEHAQSEGDWTPRARPKAAKPGMIKMRAPVELAAEGKRGAVMLTWRGPKEWSFRTDLSDLGIRPEDPDPTEVIEPALYQITNSGVVKVEGFLLSRAAVGSDTWTQVSDEVLPVLELVPQANVVVMWPEGMMGPGMGPMDRGPMDRGPMDRGPGGMGPYERRPGGGGVALESPGGATIDPATGVSRAPGGAMGPMGPYGMDGGPMGADFGMRGPGMMPGGRRGEGALPQVEFRYLDRKVTPESKYIYKVKVVGEVIKAAELSASEDPNSEENRGRLKVGDVAEKEGEPLEEPVEVLADTLIACMGGRPSSSTIMVYKWLVDDEGNTQFASERFTVRTGQQIGHVVKTLVRSQRAFEEAEGRGMGPMDDPRMMRGPMDGGAMVPGMGPMDDPSVRGTRASRGGRGRRAMDDPRMMRGPMDGGAMVPGMGPMDDPSIRAAAAAIPGGGRGMGPMDDPTMMMRGMPGIEGRGGIAGRPQRLLDEEKDVDFATGSILLDIVMEATEVSLPEREEAELTTRSPGRRQYKIVVVDRHNLLHDYWKTSAAEVQGEVSKFTGGFPIVRRRQVGARGRGRQRPDRGGGVAMESPGGGAAYDGGRPGRGPRRSSRRDEPRR